MEEIRFVWDERKAAANLAKHGVAFEEARTVFFDPAARKATKTESRAYGR
jgi:uncharacterized DUF497 family protein